MTDSEVKKLMCMPHTDEGNAAKLANGDMVEIIL